MSARKSSPRRVDDKKEKLKLVLLYEPTIAQEDWFGKLFSPIVKPVKKNYNGSDTTQYGAIRSIAGSNAARVKKPYRCTKKKDRFTKVPGAGEEA